MCASSCQLPLLPITLAAENPCQLLGFCLSCTMAVTLLHADLSILGQQFSSLYVLYFNVFERSDIECSGLVAGPRLQELAATIRRDMAEIKKLLTSYEEQMLHLQTSSLIFQDNLVNYITSHQMSDLTESVNHSNVFTGELFFMIILILYNLHAFLYVPIFLYTFSLYIYTKFPQRHSL